MIVFITTAAHRYTVRALVKRRIGQELPPVRAMSYEELFRARRVPAATFIFSDLDRLEPEGRELAADVYRGLGKAGLARLNDPEKVLLRYDLLKALHRAGINPFDVYRAGEQPRPKRFPVFMRIENEHTEPAPALIESQPALDAALDDARKRGAPLDRMIVIEFCAEPIASGLWRRFGSFRMGDQFKATLPVIENTWFVKHGTLDLAPEALHLDSLEAIRTSRHEDAIRPAFELAHIEYGRADHATVGGRQVIFEINTNPMIRARGSGAAPAPVVEGAALVRGHIATLLWSVDSGDGRLVRFPRSERLEHFRRRNSGLRRLLSWFVR